MSKKKVRVIPVSIGNATDTGKQISIPLTIRAEEADVADIHAVFNGHRIEGKLIMAPVGLDPKQPALPDLEMELDGPFLCSGYSSNVNRFSAVIRFVLNCEPKLLRCFLNRKGVLRVESAEELPAKTAAPQTNGVLVHA